MKKVRAIVEIKVPDGAAINDDDFAKMVRAALPRRLIDRPLAVKAFYRVQQYDDQGQRTRPSFNALVLFGLLLIVARLYPYRQLPESGRRWHSWLSEAIPLTQPVPWTTEDDDV